MYCMLLVAVTIEDEYNCCDVLQSVWVLFFFLSLSLPSQGNTTNLKLNH